MYTTRDFTIFPLPEKEYDVFVGKGWENWSRFKKENKILKLVKGQPLPKEMYESLMKEVNNVHLL